MTARVLPSVASFRLRHALANGLPGTLTGVLVAAYLAALLQLDPASRRAFASPTQRSAEYGQAPDQPADPA